MTQLALLFDLDGTIVCSDPLHLKAFNTLLTRYGQQNLNFSDYMGRIMGNHNEEIMADLFPHIPEKHLELADEKEALFRSSVTTDTKPAPGLLNLLDWADAQGVGKAVVTNAPKANAQTMLSTLGLADRFDMIVIGEECARAKPDPLPYQTAMNGLNTTPSRSVAFEDSGAGLRSARSSGARVFGMKSNLSAENLLRAGAHHAIDDFNDSVLWGHIRSLKEAS